MEAVRVSHFQIVCHSQDSFVRQQLQYAPAPLGTLSQHLQQRRRSGADLSPLLIPNIVIRCWMVFVQLLTLNLSGQQLDWPWVTVVNIKLKAPHRLRYEQALRKTLCQSTRMPACGRCASCYMLIES